MDFSLTGVVVNFVLLEHCNVNIIHVQLIVTASSKQWEQLAHLFGLNYSDLKIQCLKKLQHMLKHSEEFCVLCILQLPLTAIA